MKGEWDKRQGGAGEGVTVSNAGQRLNRVGLSFDNSLVTSKTLERSGNKRPNFQSSKALRPHISWRSGNSERAEVAASGIEPSCT